MLSEWGSRGTGDGRFRAPTGVAVDAAGDVYVLDSENNRVAGVRPERATSSRSGALRGAGLGEFSQPSAIAVGCDGDVYVADTNNNRVERFDPVAPAAAGCLPAGSLAAAAGRRAGAAREPCARTAACSPGARWR